MAKHDSLLEFEDNDQPGLPDKLILLKDEQMEYPSQQWLSMSATGMTGSKPPSVKSVIMPSPDMLCYSGNGLLYIKAGTFPAQQQQRLQSGQGFVVGFTGSRIFSLYLFKMTATDIPQSTSMIQYLERKMYKQAYDVACLGVTNTTLAIESLGMNLEIANIIIIMKALKSLKS